MSSKFDYYSSRLADIIFDTNIDDIENRIDTSSQLIQPHSEQNLIQQALHNKNTINNLHSDYVLVQEKINKQLKVEQSFLRFCNGVSYSMWFLFAILFFFLDRISSKSPFKAEKSTKTKIFAVIATGIIIAGLSTDYSIRSGHDNILLSLFIYQPYYSLKHAENAHSYYASIFNYYKNSVFKF